MSVFKVVVKNTVAQGAGKALGVALSLATTALLTRLLGVNGYGTYAFLTAFVLLFGTISDWGTNIIAVREASQRKDEHRIIFGTTILFRFFLTVGAVILLNLALRINPGWGPYVAPGTVASLVLLFLSLKTSLGIIFQATLKLEKTAVVEVFSSVLFLGGVFLAANLGKDLTFVMASWVIATAAAAIVGFVLVGRTPVIRSQASLIRSQASLIKWAIDKKVVKRIFWEALPAGALLLVFNLYNRIDILILEHFKGSSVVGIYGLSYKIYDTLVLGAAFLMNAMFPLFSQKFSQGMGGRKGLREYYQQTFDILIISATLLLIIVFLAAPAIIEFLAGREFRDSAVALRILIFATFIAYFNHLTGYSIIAFGKQKLSLLIAVAALIFNVSANWVFVPLYSFKAAAVITIATEGLVLIFSTIVVWRTIGIIPKINSFPRILRSFFNGEIFSNGVST